MNLFDEDRGPLACVADESLNRNLNFPRMSDADVQAKAEAMMELRSELAKVQSELAKMSANVGSGGLSSAAGTATVFTGTTTTENFPRSMMLQY